MVLDRGVMVLDSRVVVLDRGVMVLDSRVMVVDRRVMCVHAQLCYIVCVSARSPRCALVCSHV